MNRDHLVLYLMECEPDMELDIAVINLDSRRDRRSTFEENMLKRGFSPTDFYFYRAKETPGYGQLGCARSHLGVLVERYIESEADFYLIMEDDYQLEITKDELENLVGEFSDIVGLDGGVWLLNSLEPIVLKSQDFEQWSKVLRSYTTAAYLFPRAYVKTIISIFAKSVHLLEKNRTLLASLNKAHQDKNISPEANYLRKRIYEYIAVDNIWAAEQLNHKFWIFNAGVGRTIGFESDIQ